MIKSHIFRFLNDRDAFCFLSSIFSLQHLEKSTIRTSTVFWKLSFNSIPPPNDALKFYLPQKQNHQRKLGQSVVKMELLTLPSNLRVFTSQATFVQTVVGGITVEFFYQNIFYLKSFHLNIGFFVRRDSRIFFLQNTDFTLV